MATNQDLLTKLGLSRQEAEEVLLWLQPLVQAEFERRVQEEFSLGERGQMDSKYKAKTPAESVAILEKEYAKKTGRKFPEVYGQIEGEVTAAVARAVEAARVSWKKLIELGPQKVKELAQAVAGQDAATTKLILQQVGAI